ncbi:alpha/beta hydrolase [Nocardiopsis sp. CC223A]|uniref:alpha/beta hydrolase n=1 Tax=Nocardiopsis sp. CC223A TaxID=3044051 RepID=UPI00278BC776|nr:alpha/beta hydrolase [Nocardiopsis sp. CC223A]
MGSAAATALLLAACLPPPVAEPTAEEVPERYAGQEIAWADCPGREAPLECGTVTVPLDHDRPDGETLELALIRSPSDGSPQEPIGSLVVNPGGPGVPGTGMFHDTVFSDRIRASFDLVSFDPRGVGASGALSCGDRYAMEDARQAVSDTHPRHLTEVDLQPLDDTARRYARSCTETAGEEALTEIGTVNVVRDLDIVRDALGDDTLTYVGYSYGTHIGALYAHMYPERTRALVLDAAVDTDASTVETALDQAAAFQAAWERFVDHCAATEADCPFTPGADPDTVARELFEKLDRDPASADGIPVDGGLLLLMATAALYREGAWDLLADAFAALTREQPGESGGELLALYEELFGGLGGEEAGPGTGGDHGDPRAAYTAVTCADHASPTDVTEYRDAAARAVELSPLFGADTVWEQLPCAHWQHAERPPTGFTAPDAPPVVVVGAVGDPATPYAWSRELAGRLESAVLVTYEGGGHTLYGAGRVPCVEEAVDAYLIGGEVPPEGLICPES